MPARGPLNDLWVVVVTISQYGNGWSASSAATRPLQRQILPQHQLTWFASLRTLTRRYFANQSGLPSFLRLAQTSYNEAA
jgi:hypothetical protein